MAMETPNTVTVGHICFSCALRATKQCPYKNHLVDKVMSFRSDIRGKCCYYLPLVEAETENRMTKEAAMISEAQLNVELYKKIASMNEKQKKDFLSYWGHIYPEGYAKEMVLDDNETEQKSLKKMKDESKKKFYKRPNFKNKEDKEKN